MSRLPENVTDIAVLVQCTGQGAILGAVAPTDSVTARRRTDSICTPRSCADSGDDAINKLLPRSFRHAQQT